MAPDSLSSNFDQLALALKDLSEKVSGLPATYREQIAPDVEQLRKCLEDQAQQGQKEETRTLTGSRTRTDSKDGGGESAAALNKDETRFYERRDAEQKSEGKFAMAFRSSPAALAISRFSDGALVDVNKNFCSLTGYARAEILGRTSLELGLFANPEESYELNELLREQGRVRDYELKTRAKSGELLILLFSIELIELDGELCTLLTGIDITERKRAEATLRANAEALRANTEALKANAEALLERETIVREREKLYRAIGESIDYGVWICDPDGRNLYSSPSFLQLLGMTQKECYGFGWASRLHPDDRERTLAAWKECVNTGGRWDMEHRFLGRDGRYHPILARGVPVRDERDEIVAWAGINLDIGRQKRTEEALRESQERLSGFLESTHDYIYALDRDWKYIFANRRYCEQRGLEASSLIGKDFWEVNFRYLGTEIERNLRKAMREREPVYFQATGRYNPNWLEISAYPTRDGISVFAKDRTDEYRAEQALRESEQKFQSIFHHAPFAIALTSASDSVTVDVNQAFLDLFGFEKQEVIGKTSVELGVVQDSKARTRIFEEIRQKGSLRGQELGYRTKTGEPLVVLMNADLLTVGEKQFFLTAVENITERKQAEMLLKERNKALRESEAALRRSAANERARAKELEALMDAVPAMIWVSHDPECREMVGNRAGLEILQESGGANVSSTAPGEVLARQKYRNMKDGRLIPVSELPMQVAAATGKQARNYTYDIVFDDGTTYNLVGNVNPLLDAEGRPAGSVGAFVDISAIRRLEAERVEAITEIEVQRRLIEQREQERQQIARDIHDGPIQTLVSTIFNLQVTKEALTDRQLQVELNQIGLSIKNTIQELREVVNELRPPLILRLGLSRAILIHAEDFREKHPELDVQLELSGEKIKLPESTALTIFRIYQETMNNVIRHAEATQVLVRLSIAPERAILEIQDNGKGFAIQPDLVKQIETGHYGMAGMKERAEALNGKLEIQSQPGGGTTVRVSVPLE